MKGELRCGTHETVERYCRVLGGFAVHAPQPRPPPRAIRSLTPSCSVGHPPLPPLFRRRCGGVYGAPPFPLAGAAPVQVGPSRDVRRGCLVAARVVKGLLEPFPCACSAGHCSSSLGVGARLGRGVGVAITWLGCEPRLILVAGLVAECLCAPWMAWHGSEADLRGEGARCGPSVAGLATV